MPYQIRDENDEVMRIVGRREEAENICAFRIGWTFIRLPNKSRKIDLSKFEDALF